MIGAVPACLAPDSTTPGGTTSTGRTGPTSGSEGDGELRAGEGEGGAPPLRLPLPFCSSLRWLRLGAGNEVGWPKDWGGGMTGFLQTKAVEDGRVAGDLVRREQPINRPRRVLTSSPPPRRPRGSLIPAACWVPRHLPPGQNGARLLWLRS